MRIAVVQTNVVYGQPDANFRRMSGEVLDLSEQGVELAVFPEAFFTGYGAGTAEEARRIALPTPKEYAGYPLWKQVEDLTKQTGTGVVAGYAAHEGGRFHNAASMWIPGSAPVTYFKTHLPCLGMDRFLEPGDQLPVFDTKFGKIGILICYDLRPPEPSRVLALKGADLILLPTNWPKTQTAEHYTIVRASENKVFLASCNRIGSEGGTSFVGLSGIYDPHGEPLVLAGTGEETLIADIDLALSRQKRNVYVEGEYELDLWGCRKPGVYSEITK